MSRITVYGSKKNRKAVLEYLQRKRIIDISEPEPDNQEYGFTTLDTGGAQSEFLQNCRTGGRALEVLDGCCPEKHGLAASLNGRRQLDSAEYYSYVDDIPEMLSIAKRLIELSEEIAERKGRIVKYRSEIEELTPWLPLDTEMGGAGTKSSAFLIGTFPEELRGEDIIEKYSGDDAPPMHIEVVSAAPKLTCVFMLCKAEDAEECEKRMRRIGFSRPKTEHRGVPADEIHERERIIEALEKEIGALREEICSYRGARHALEFMSDYYLMRAEKYKVLSKLSQSRRAFVITGYIPTAAAPSLIAVLEHEYDAAAETETAGDDAPVLLKNAYLAEPVEGIVKTFAMPAKGEIDPTAIMSFFYYIFFGLMLSDAGYGLLITIGCFIALKKFRSMESDMRKTLRMFMYCGISTVFWGLLFGSWFGDAVQVISQTFFNTSVTIPPLWFEPVKDPMRMLMVSFLFGLVHLFTALGIKLYQCIKAKDILSAFVDCIFWYMLVGGGVMYLFSMDMFLSIAGLTQRLPAFWANVAAVTAGIGALGIVIFSGRSGGVLKRLAKGAYALYGATSWLSDILSYSRLLALGLATGVIATVFNKMGSMFGGGILGAILFTLVFVIGHALNIGINLLGAYVHTNRLQFVEFFGKFYEGGGREFKPFAGDTRYYKFKEEK